MTKDQLTPEKVARIEGISYQIKAIEEDAAMVSTPLPESIISGDCVVHPPMRQYEDLIRRHNVGDLFETFRLLLFARLQKKEQELKAQLLEQINS